MPKYRVKSNAAGHTPQIKFGILPWLNISNSRYATLDTAKSFCREHAARSKPVKKTPDYYTEVDVNEPDSNT